LTYVDLWDGTDLIVVPNEGGVKYTFAVDPWVDPSKITVLITGHDSIRLIDDGDLVIETALGEIVDSGLIAFYEDMPLETVPVKFVMTEDDSYTYSVDHYDKGRRLMIDPIIYSTFIGGERGCRIGGIALDGDGYVYVAGSAGPEVTGDILGIPDAPPNISMAFVAKFDPDDGTLLFSTILGGSNHTVPYDMHVDFLGFIYLTGETSSADFPVTDNAFQRKSIDGWSRIRDAFICKLSRDGGKLMYSTFLSGGHSDQGEGITVDKDGLVYVTGTTWSDDFPVFEDAYQSTYGGRWMDAFICKLDPFDGKVHFLTYLGGNSDDNGEDIRVDDKGFIYVTGYTFSRNFPTTPGAPYRIFRGGQSDGFIVRFSSDGSELIDSTLVGGSGVDRGYGLEIDRHGNAYVSGLTDSTDLPTTEGAFRPVGLTKWDSFVCKLRSDWSSFEYLTYVGGSEWNTVHDIAIDVYGYAYVAGTTCSDDLVTTDGAHQRELLGNCDAFIQVLDRDGTSLLFSTYHGGNDSEDADYLVLDHNGSIYIAGSTWSSDFPVTDNALQTQYGGGQTDSYYSRINYDIDVPRTQTLNIDLWPWFLILLFVILACLAYSIRKIRTRTSVSEEP
jgi:hypothetical protein